MHDRLRASPNKIYRNRQEAKEIIGLKDSYHAVYNPSLITQLEVCRSNLDREYFALLDAIDNNQPLKIRALFAQFNETLLRYLNKNRVELYGYLDVLYASDREIMIIIEANQAALDAVIDTITKTLVDYISPSANYNEQFRRELQAIWTILKWRYYRENALLYPLYHNRLESA